MYRMIDGRIYHGDTFQAVVDDMRHDKLRRARSRKRYRTVTAERVGSVYGVEVDSTSDEAFIRSLEQAGLMEEVSK